MATDYDALSGMYENAGKLQQQEIEKRYKLGKEQIDGSYKEALLRSGDTRAGIEESREYHRGQLEQAKAEMEKIGIPKVEIDKYVAEKTYEIAKGELDFKKEDALRKFGLDESAVTGTYNGQQTQAAQKQAYEQGVTTAGLTGTYQGQQTQAAQKQAYDQWLATTQEGRAAQQQQFDQGLALTQDQRAQQKEQFSQWLQTSQEGRALTQQAFQQGIDLAGVTGTYGGAETEAAKEYRLTHEQTQLEEQRRYNLDVAKYGTELESTPDQYFQARRFAAMAPRLQGTDTSGTTLTGDPTAQISTLGARLGQGATTQGAASGATTSGAATSGAPYSAGVGDYATGSTGAASSDTYSGIASPSSSTTGGGASTEGAPYSAGVGDYATGAADDRAKQVQTIAKTSPPSPYDGLDEQDSATLRLMESIYKKGGQSVSGGEMERLKASGQSGFMESAGKLLGYDPKAFEATYQAYRPTQGSSAAAG